MTREGAPSSVCEGVGEVRVGARCADGKKGWKKEEVGRKRAKVFEPQIYLGECSRPTIKPTTSRDKTNLKTRGAYFRNRGPIGAYWGSSPLVFAWTQIELLHCRHLLMPNFATRQVGTRDCYPESVEKQASVLMQEQKLTLQVEENRIYVLREDHHDCNLCCAKQH